MLSENELIEHIRRRFAPRAAVARKSGLLLGIGDDAAVLRPSGRADCVLTCDAFLENVHFLAAVHPAEAVGYKALARATSDLAAMGATPRYFLLSLALPANRTEAWLDSFLRGLARAARRLGVTLAGGDTSRHPTIAISITAVGEVSKDRAVTRSGARPGDLIYVSGRLGAAQLGLELILSGLHRKRRWKPLLRRHLYPDLHLDLGRWLAERQLASAMIDTSDGLSTDLGHLCRASRVGARLWANCIPRVRVPPALLARGIDPEQLALHGGEDYELLFTVRGRLSKLIPDLHRGTPISAIGEIIRGRKMVLVEADGRSVELVARGWDHFRTK